MMFDPQKARRDFPILSTRINGKPLVYLDNAATTQKPRQVMDQLTRFYKLQNSNVHRGSHTLSNNATQLFEESRSTLAKFIGATDPREVIWTKGATEAVNLLAFSLCELALEPGDTILVSTMEHHANIVPWQQAAQRKGAHLRPIPLTSDQTIDVEAYKRLIKEYSPKIVALTHVSNALGVINPIQYFCELGKQCNAIMVIDGSQAIAHLPVDVSALGCDFYFFSGHKCYAPGGVGVLWGKRNLLEAMPPWQCGGEMIEHVSFETTTFNQLPFKFEAGTPPVADVMALATAIDYLNTLDRPAIMAHELALRNRVIEQLQPYPEIKIYALHAPNIGIISLSLENIHHQDLAVLLDEQGIAVRTGHHCAMPLMQSLGITGTLRVSFALYNTLAEADFFCDTIIDLLEKHRTSIDNTATTDQTSVQSSPIQYIPKTELKQFAASLLDASPQERLAKLITAGEAQPQLPLAYKVPSFQVKGCESNVWLVSKEELIDGKKHLFFAACSDARIMNGLIRLVLSVVQGQQPEQVKTFDYSQLLKRYQLERFLSPSRTNGLRAIVAAITDMAYT